jgi:urease accessory protein
MLLITQRLPPNHSLKVDFTLSLTAEERQRSRYQFVCDQGEKVALQLPRGTLLEDGDILSVKAGNLFVRVLAKAEPVLTITAAQTLALIRVAYHLGNRHVPVEITSSYLRLSPDSVLQNMLAQLEVEIREEVTPFYPEKGAYFHAHS